MPNTKKLKAKFYGPNKVWILHIEGFKEPLYLYPNGTIKEHEQALGQEINCYNKTQEITNE